jgi:hypothetical protein
LIALRGTGSRKDDVMQGEEQDGQPFAAGADPEVWAWLRGVDYTSGWRTARDAADTLNAAPLMLDIWPWELRAVADTDAEGNGWVRLLGTAEGATRLAEALETAQRKKGAA